MVFVTILQGQTALKITNEGTLKLEDNASIVIKDGKFENDGTFESGMGTVKITGTADDAESTIGGNTPTIFHNLTIDKSSNNAQMEQNIEVKGTLDLQSGHIDLQDQQLTILFLNILIALPASAYIGILVAIISLLLAFFNAKVKAYFGL